MRRNPFAARVKLSRETPRRLAYLKFKPSHHFQFRLSFEDEENEEKTGIYMPSQ